MFLKDHLIDTYQKASLDKNNLILENVINRWAHRFGIETLNELLVKNQNQINLIEEDQEEENQNQINLIEEDQEEENQNQINLIEEDQEEENQNQINLIEEDQEEENQNQINLIEEDQEEENQDQNNLKLLENVQFQKEIDFKSEEEKKINNTEIINEGIKETSKYKSKNIGIEELPLPNINSLRKWIKNEKKAS